MTRSVKQLVEQGYLATRPGREDQRRTEVSLTAKAEVLAAHSKAEIWPRIERAVSDLCGAFGPALLQELDAIETLQLLVGRGEKYGKAHLLLGRLLLDQGNEHGLQNLTHAAIQDPALVEEAGQLGYGYLVERGRKREAQRFWERISA